MDTSTRTFIVSNRLPVSTSVVGGRTVLERSSGGLVSGLEGVHDSEGSRWVGCLGGGQPAGGGNGLSDADAGKLHAQGFRMVEVPKGLYTRYYDGFSNSAIWPLFHYMPERCHFSSSAWESYQRVNELFADKIAGELAPGDRVWVHDYQLMLLPALLRDRCRDVRIGFFLHVPFPSTEVFRVLPWRREILAGLLGADLVGFHTLEYLRHFSNSVSRVMGLEPQMDSLHYGRRTVRLGAFPLGINVGEFHRAAHDKAAQEQFESLTQSYAGRTVLLGVDRLDYTKGIPARLKAFAQALERNPDWVGKVSLVQISVPSRVKVEEYQEIKDEVDGLVGHINGRFGATGYVPIHYIFRNLERADLMALYRRADVMVVTPIRDGLNLVCKEYVAAKGSEPGALVLSEFAGSAAEMGEAVLVNPWSQDSMVEGIEKAVGMSDKDKVTMMSSLWERLNRYDNKAWSQGFLSSLAAVPTLSVAGGQAEVGGPDDEELRVRISKAVRAFFFLDYDGTLVPVADKPELALPTEPVLELLRNMTIIPNFRVCVVSGRDREFLETHLPRGVSFVAEHGACLRRAGDSHVTPLVETSVYKGLRETVLAMMTDFERRIPGSKIEQKEYGVVWHYRMADPIFGPQQALVLADTLGGLLERTPLGVLTSKKAVEVRPVGANKGNAVRYILREEGFDTRADVIMTIGDDRTDEDMFLVHPRENISISVSEEPMVAHYVMEQPDLLRLLEGLASSSKGWQYRLWERS
ncbi:MAG: bifunctional alpha,alpha-trehalose-phosphate synthase (UDP-forming)/trehalose-phosphatase [Deltaproteobacteria bacterium]